VVNGNLYESSQLDSTVKYELYKEIQLQQTLTNIIHATASGRKLTDKGLAEGENTGG
jgi:hypothetical protein